MRWLANIRDARRAYADRQFATADHWHDEADAYDYLMGAKTMRGEWLRLGAEWARLKAVILGGVKLS